VLCFASIVVCRISSVRCAGRIAMSGAVDRVGSQCRNGKGNGKSSKGSHQCALCLAKDTAILQLSAMLAAQSTEIAELKQRLNASQTEKPRSLPTPPAPCTQAYGSIKREKTPPNTNSEFRAKLSPEEKNRYNELLAMGRNPSKTAGYPREWAAFMASLSDEVRRMHSSYKPAVVNSDGPLSLPGPPPGALSLNEAPLPCFGQ
jgi:hypothetical protein